MLKSQASVSGALLRATQTAAKGGDLEGSDGLLDWGEEGGRVDRTWASDGDCENWRRRRRGNE